MRDRAEDGLAVERSRFPARSPVFLAASSASQDEVLLLDTFEIPIKFYEENVGFRTKIMESLKLGESTGRVGCAELIELLVEQYDAASEFVYGHPIWSSIRAGNRRYLLAYILETRHYLAAASFRMAPAIHPGIGLDALTKILSKHLLEEWDHERFFVEALTGLGCHPNMVRSARPLPTTIEWIYLNHFIASKGALNAAVCSGFMEQSSTEVDAVRGWHTLLCEAGLLPASSVSAIFSHFETDLGHGHAANWQRAIEAHGPVSVTDACELLNDVCTLAEMIYRWLSSLCEGGAADVVTGLELMSESEEGVDGERHILCVKVGDGLPVLSAGLMDQVTWGDNATPAAAKIVMATTYAMAHELVKPTSNFHEGIGGLAKKLLAQEALLLPETQNLDTLCQMAEGWLKAIDGHSLWETMLNDPKDALITGYFIESFHYLASAARHIGPAVGSSLSPQVRRSYIYHLEDELEHCDILSKRLIDTAGVDTPAAMRPLPTTVAFVGYLQSLARSNWRSYVLVSTFLQSSLAATRRDNRPANFYDRLSQACPRLRPLIGTMAEHDDLDAQLHHDEVHRARLEELIKTGSLSTIDIEQAAVAPSLAWSFLDGILRHYRSGDGAVLQRVGWRSH